MPKKPGILKSIEISSLHWSAENKNQINLLSSHLWGRVFVHSFSLKLMSLPTSVTIHIHWLLHNLHSNDRCCLFSLWFSTNTVYFCICWIYLSYITYYRMNICMRMFNRVGIFENCSLWTDRFCLVFDFLAKWSQCTSMLPPPLYRTILFVQYLSINECK